MTSSIKEIMTKIPYYNQLVKPLHIIETFHAASKNNYPGATMKVIGVTGTNGKTTTTWMIYSILREKFGDKVGVMSTIGWGWGDEIQNQTAHATTENPAVLQKHLAKMREAGVEYVVLEVSSHALAQHRVFGIPFDAAVFTNLSPDHLDYHKTMTKYREAKERLFKLVAKNHSGAQLGVINDDDAVARFFERDVPKMVRYGLKKTNDITAKHVKLAPTGVEYDLILNDAAKNTLKISSNKSHKFHIKTQIPGEFNVYNSLAATAIGLQYGVTPTEITRGIAKLASVPGRMDAVDEGQDFSVIIDFATTPDAFENVLPGIRATTKGRLITLFGLPGRRDQTKGSAMGKVAAQYADVIILTEDDARGNVRAQSDKIAAGIPADFTKNCGKVQFIDDRTAAINQAIALARPDDTVVLLGKGPEKIIARQIGDKVVDQPWDEAATARAAIQKSLKSTPKTRRTRGKRAKK